MQFQKPSADSLRKRFLHHPPVAERYAEIRSMICEIRSMICNVAIEIVEMTPCCPEQTLCLNALDEAMFLANAAIARNEAAEEEAPKIHTGGREGH